MISLIWAMDENHLIGKNNGLPWHYPKDLAYFKQQTKHKAVLMGQKTYESLKTYYKTKPFPFGKVYVASREEKVYPDAFWVDDIHHFLKECDDDLMVIGGKMIYQLALPYANRLWITYVLGAHEGDTYFPKFNLDDFKLTHYQTEEKLIFAVYDRRTR